MNPENAQQLASALFSDDPELPSSTLPSIDGYTLRRELGRGGAGIVYEGVHIESDRPVAIKIYYSDGGPSVLAAIYELDHLSSVRSPIVPHVIEHGWIDERAYLVTELIEGKDPLEYASSLGIRARVELLERITNAVSTLNARGIIHRDLKPSNILITSDGNPVILDLGISTSAAEQAANSEDDRTRSSVPMGTLAYMAPEQARGENNDISVLWDVYALGAIGYELLVCDTPHGLKSSITQNLEAVGKGIPRTPREIDPKIPKGIDSVLSKACAFDPEERYESAQAFRDDLRRWINHEPIEAGPQSVLMKSIRFSIRHPKLTLLMLCVSIFAFTMIATTAVVWRQNMLAYRFADSISNRTMITSIQSRSGRELHTWRTEDDHGIGFPGRVLQGSDEKYAVLGLTSPDIASGHAGLVGYRLGNYDEPAWVAEQRVPAGLSYAVRHEPAPHEFRFRFLKIADVFPEIDGLEIISIHIHSPYSVCAIQIHSVDGQLLSEYYHDGWALSVHWNAAHNQLVVAAQNSDGNWVERGADEIWFGKYPVVIFAINPKIGENNRVIRHPGLPNGMDPLWYRCLMPGSAYSTLRVDRGVVGVNVNRPGLLKYRLKNLVEIQLGGKNDGIGEHATMVIDHQGELVEVWATDTWKTQQNGLDPSVFTLEDLPRRTTEREFKP